MTLFFSLKDLFINFDDSTFAHTQEWLPSSLNLMKIRLLCLKTFYPSEMIRILTNEAVKEISVGSECITFSQECFEKLISHSQLRVVTFDAKEISTDPSRIVQVSIINSSLEDLYLLQRSSGPENLYNLFPQNFIGLIHLTLGRVTDSFLQTIFRCQVNSNELYFIF